MDNLDDEPQHEEVSSGALAYETVDDLSLCALATPTAARGSSEPINWQGTNIHLIPNNEADNTSQERRLCITRVQTALPVRKLIM